MPWTLRDAIGKTHRATTVAKKRQWAATANSVLKRTGSDAAAIRIANAAIRKK